MFRELSLFLNSADEVVEGRKREEKLIFREMRQKANTCLGSCYLIIIVAVIFVKMNAIHQIPFDYSHSLP